MRLFFLCENLGGSSTLLFLTLWVDSFARHSSNFHHIYNQVWKVMEPVAFKLISYWKYLVDTLRNGIHERAREVYLCVVEFCRLPTSLYMVKDDSICWLLSVALARCFLFLGLSSSLAFVWSKWAFPFVQDWNTLVVAS